MADDDILLNQTVPTRRMASRLARSLGCQGAHKAPDAEDDGWHPCESAEALSILINKGAAGYRSWKERQTAKKHRTVFNKKTVNGKRRRTFLS